MHYISNITIINGKQWIHLQKSAGNCIYNSDVFTDLKIKLNKITLRKQQVKNKSLKVIYGFIVIY